MGRPAVLSKKGFCENFSVQSKFGGRVPLGHTVPSWSNKLKLCGNELTTASQMCNLPWGHFPYLVKHNLLMFETCGFQNEHLLSSASSLSYCTAAVGNWACAPVARLLWP